MADDHSSCQKEAILKEMHQEHTILEKHVNDKLTQGELRFLAIDAKLGTLLEQSQLLISEYAKVQKQLFIDNGGTQSHQTRLHDNRKAIDINTIAIKSNRNAINSIIGWMRWLFGITLTTFATVLIMLISKVVDHMVP